MYCHRRPATGPCALRRFLAFPVSEDITPEQMRDYVQCIIRDTATHSAPRDYFLIEGARSWTVSDQMMKKEIILQGMGWGHMPDFLVDDELRRGRLVSIAGRHFKGGQSELVAARKRRKPHGPIANRLWQYIQDQAAGFRRAVRS